ncbi:hypothetical protein VNI00_014531 [Paramarasmius palmivorus]|uniref:F-box domain-containing protein n=1 Tax=Paramarasmius palmivorus TaxID=297713 RepID=A0AAW0BRF0_9AGAR
MTTNATDEVASDEPTVMHLQFSSPLQSKFPNELISVMLTHLDTGDAKDLLSATWVCRKWRIAALSTPSLWTRIDLKSPSLVQLFLDRAGSLPLQLELSEADGYQETEEDFIAHILITIATHLDRMSSLDIAMSPQSIDILNILAERAQVEPLQSFRNLRIVCAHQPLEECVGEIDFHCPIIDLNFPSPLFGATLPSLTKLEISLPMVYQWTSSFQGSMASLSFLSLTHCQLANHGHDATRPAMVDLLRVLASAPLLESLVLGGVIPACSTVSLPPPLEMQALSSLKIFGATSLQCTQLVECLVMSRLVAFEAECFHTESDWCEDDSGYKTSGLILLLKKIPVHVTNSGLTQLDVEVSRMVISGLARCEMSLRASHPENTPPAVTLKMTWVENGEHMSLMDIATTMRSSLACFDWNALTYLKLKTTGNYSSIDALVDICVELSGLTDLVVAGSCVPIFLRRLGSVTQRDMPFPSLARLTLDHINIALFGCKPRLYMTLGDRIYGHGQLKSLTLGSGCINHCDREWIDSLESRLSEGVEVLPGDYASSYMGFRS